MKLTQAVILASVGSAVVVSAVPTKGFASGRVQRHNNAGKKSRLNSIYKFGSSALRHAGGVEGAATAAASIYNLRQAHKAQKAAEALASRDIAEPVAATNQTATLAAAAATTGTGHHKKGQHKHNGHRGQRFHHRVNGAAGRVTPSPGEHDAHKHSKPASAVDGTVPAEKLTARGHAGLVPSKAPAHNHLLQVHQGPKTAAEIANLHKETQAWAHKQKRDFDDLEFLDARDLEELEELIARAHQGPQTAAELAKLRKESQMWENRAAQAAFSSHRQKRDFDDLESLDARDLIDFDELEMRDFDFELNELD